MRPLLASWARQASAWTPTCEAANNQNALHAIAAIRSRTGAKYSPPRERRFGAVIAMVIPAPLITNLGNKAVSAVPIKLTHFNRAPFSASQTAAMAASTLSDDEFSKGDL